ncbi:MAG: GNAT family N-acetyltransferase [Treponemataceae bacterium]|nr:GNAT family N-acetyltransferase [Treponemataceae bacterium]
MPLIELVLAQNADTLARCLRVREEVFTIEKGVPKEIEVDALDCLNGACEHFLIRCNEKDAGALRCTYTPENAARIQRFCVLKEYRKRRIGKAALEQVESCCRSRGCRAVELDAKLSAAGFYEKCGYKIVSDTFIEADVEHVKMRKGLSAKLHS